MSIKVMTAVWDHSQHKGGDLLLLLALADFAHDDGGNIFPSVETMRKKVRLSERGVQYIISKLVKSGELVPDGKHSSGTKKYRIDLAMLGGAKIAPTSAGVQPIAPGGAKSRTPGVQPIAPDPLSKNHQQPLETDEQFARHHSNSRSVPKALAAQLVARHTRDGKLDRDRFMAALPKG